MVLPLTHFTGVGFAAFFFLNGYLLGGNVSNWRPCGGWGRFLVVKKAQIEEEWIAH